MLKAYARSGYRAESPYLEYDRLNKSDRKSVDQDRKFRSDMAHHTKGLKNYRHDPSRHIMSHFNSLSEDKILNSNNSRIGAWFQCCVLDALMVFKDSETGATLDPGRLRIGTHVSKERNAEVDILVCTSRALEIAREVEDLSVKVHSFEGVWEARTSVSDWRKRLRALSGEYAGAPFHIHLKRSLRERWKQPDRDAIIASFVCHPIPHSVALFDRESASHDLETSRALAVERLRMSNSLHEFYTVRDSEAILDLFKRIVNS